MFPSWKHWEPTSDPKGRQSETRVTMRCCGEVVLFTRTECKRYQIQFDYVVLTTYSSEDNACSYKIQVISSSSNAWFRDLRNIPLEMSLQKNKVNFGRQLRLPLPSVFITLVIATSPAWTRGCVTYSWRHYLSRPVEGGSAHISPVLKSLHWPVSSSRIYFKILLLVSITVRPHQERP